MTNRDDDIDPVPPDDKDWTWVLEQPCPECGLDAKRLDVTATGDAVRANATQWLLALERPSVGQRPDPATWSVLEYACHVRDVFTLFDRRLHRMLDENDPLFDNWDQDAAAIEQRYHEQDPRTVAEELAAAAETTARSFDAVGADQWQRPGRRSDGSAFSVESFARYFIHDPVHHLHDIGTA